MFFVKGEHHELTSIVLVLLLLSSQKLVQAVTSIQRLFSVVFVQSLHGLQLPAGTIS